MSQPDQLSYYRSREAAERQLAATAASPAIRDIHLELATRYAELCQGSGREKLRLVTGLAASA